MPNFVSLSVAVTPIVFPMSFASRMFAKKFVVQTVIVDQMKFAKVYNVSRVVDLMLIVQTKKLARTANALVIYKPCQKKFLN